MLQRREGIHPVLMGYQPDTQEKATQTVLEQAEVLSQGWTLE